MKGRDVPYILDQLSLQVFWNNIKAFYDETIILKGFLETTVLVLILPVDWEILQSTQLISVTPFIAPTIDSSTWNNLSLWWYWGYRPYARTGSKGWMPTGNTTSSTPPSGMVVNYFIPQPEKRLLKCESNWSCPHVYIEKRKECAHEALFMNYPVKSESSRSSYHWRAWSRMHA